MDGIFFGIPLRSRSTTDNWPQVCSLFEATLASIRCQTDPDLRIVLACHEQPAVKGIDDPRLVTLTCNVPSPGKQVARQFIDKRYKLRMLLEHVCRSGGGYLVMMDADDLVSRRLTAHIRADDNGRGYLFRRGYILSKARRRFRLVEDFYRHSGTSAVFHLRQSDLTTLEDGFLKQVGLGSHPDYPEIAARAGRPLTDIPFPAAVYIRHHGENLSVSKRSRWRLTAERNAIASAASRLLPGRHVPPELRAEFGLSTEFYR